MSLRSAHIPTALALAAVVFPPPPTPRRWGGGDNQPQCCAQPPPTHPASSAPSDPQASPPRGYPEGTIPTLVAVGVEVSMGEVRWDYLKAD